MAEGAPIGNSRAKKQHGQDVQVDLSRREIKDGTAGRIGKQYGVNGRTIRRDADFAKGVDLEKTLLYFGENFQKKAFGSWRLLVGFTGGGSPSDYPPPVCDG